MKNRSNKQLKIFLTTFAAIILGFSSCEKNNNSEPADYRDPITGTYSGIEVITYWVDSNIGFGRDTSEILITLSKSELDSIIDISFDPSYTNDDFSFKYNDGEFKSTTYYHPPTLTLTDDSLYFWHQPGLGPVWMECFTKKSAN
jgi:hypothetical protein